MLSQIFAAALLLPLCHALPTIAVKDSALAGRQTTCAAVHILIARGTTEEYPGDMGSLANLIIANNDDADYEDVIYPATFDYISSTRQGMSVTMNQLTAYVEACPQSKIVLLGYSQVRRLITEHSPFPILTRGARDTVDSARLTVLLV